MACNLLAMAGRSKIAMAEDLFINGKKMSVRGLMQRRDCLFQGISGNSKQEVRLIVSNRINENGRCQEIVHLEGKKS